MGKKTFWAAIAIIGTVGGLVLPAAGNVFDDAVFWFRGGKDRVNGGGDCRYGRERETPTGVELARLEVESHVAPPGWRRCAHVLLHAVSLAYATLSIRKINLRMPIHRTKSRQFTERNYVN